VQAAEAKRAETERKAVSEAERIVSIWNARQAGGRALWFYPTNRSRDRGRPPVALLLLPGVRAVRLHRPADARSAPGRGDFKLDPVSVVPAMLAQRPIRAARNVDGGTRVRFEINQRRTLGLVAIAANLTCCSSARLTR
jgi:hypothetical protein